MNLCRVVIILQTGRNEGVGADNAVNEVRAALNHTLIDEFAERLILAHIAQVIEEFIPETGVNQMAGGVLGSAYVQVNIAPVGIHLAVHEGLVIVRIHIAQIVGA